MTSRISNYGDVSRGEYSESLEPPNWLLLRCSSHFEQIPRVLNDTKKLGTTTAATTTKTTTITTRVAKLAMNKESQGAL